MTTHSSIRVWTIPKRKEEPGGRQSMGLQRVGLDKAHSTAFYLVLIKP